MPLLYVPNVSVNVEITNLAGVKLAVKGQGETINFDVKAKLEEKEHKSQTVVVGFNLFLTTKPNILKIDIAGTATLSGKDADVKKMLEVDPETKVPQVLHRIYQQAFTAMYLLSAVLDAPPPPHDLLSSQKQGIQMEEETANSPSDGVTVQADIENTATAK
ncbi:MAG: hypothetical protein QHH24_01885 [Candidatus Bathyarchaeota archaeon]|nr:hypothetical protein [Candidatus Bathyarchaeota archaeon]